MSPSSSARLIALGGLGEVGMNCFVVEQNERLLVVDCGTTFPGDDYGVDVVHPDFRWLHEQWSRVDGIFLTHGHEDHIGALPYLLGQRSAPIWGPRHALALVRRRLDDHGIRLSESLLCPVGPGAVVSAGAFAVEPIRVSHSIVEATALAFFTPAGTIVHSGDFKFDPAPSDGEPTDEMRFAELGEQGVELLLSDSTNVLSNGVSGSEANVETALDELVRNAPRRVFVALFASNVQRLISLGKIAQRRGRRIVLLGRSVGVHVEVARDLGYLDWPRDLVLPLERVRTYPKNELLILASGTQGEPAAAMARLAQGVHRVVDVDPGDTVIFSSRVIPGCEKPVSQMVGQLLRRGAVVESGWTSGVHTSGHANRDEQQRLIELLQPKAFIPVHGTRHHLQRHAQLASACGVGNPMVIENGQSVVLEAGQVRLGESVTAGRVHVAYGGAVLQSETLDRRRELGRFGVLSVGLMRDQRGQLCAAPALQAVGLPHLDRAEVLQELATQLSNNWSSLQRSSESAPASNGALSRSSQSSERPAFPRTLSAKGDALSVQIERFVQRWADENFGLRPVVAVQLLDLPSTSR